MDSLQLKEIAASKKKENVAFFNRIKKLHTHDIDALFHQAHEDAFEQIDCLSCANCCKTTSPLLLQSDINRIAKYLKQKEKDFYKQYIRVDEDGDYIFQYTPCPFLGNDNLCSIYEARPNACREYPHTNRKKIVQILDLTLQNYAICPAVQHIVERLKEDV